MRKRFLAIALAALSLAGIAEAQQIVRVTPNPTNSGAFARRVIWSQLNKSFVIRPPSANFVLTVSVRNRSVSGQGSFLIQAEVTSDETAAYDISGGAIGWKTVDGLNALYPGSAGTTLCSASFRFVGASTQEEICRYQLYNAKQVAITISSASNGVDPTSTADMYYAFTPLVSPGDYPMFGKTSAGSYLPIQVDIGGKIVPGDVGGSSGDDSSPATGSQATVTAPGGGASQITVINCISASASATVAPAATQLEIEVLDGATRVWAHEFFVNAAVGQLGPTVDICGLNLSSGFVNQTMTVRFSAALANLRERVSASWRYIGQ